MPTFQYKAKQRDAQAVTGQVLADNKEEAIEKVNQLGLIPVSIEELRDGTANKSVVRNGSVNTKTLYRFTRQLSHLVKAGVPLLRAMELVTIQLRHPYFQHVLQSISSAVRDGQSFSEALAEYPKIFSPLFVTMVKAGEESGNLKESLGDMAAYLQRQEEINGKVRMAMVYPALMALMGALTVIFILTFVMPKLTGLFQNLGQALPMATQVVMAVSDFMVHWWLFVVVLVLVLVVGLRRWGQTKNGQSARSQLVLSLPLLRDFALKVEMTRFCSTLALLLKSGVPIVRAIELTIPVVGNELIGEQLKKCQADLVAGRSLGESLRQASLLPVMISHMISVGEETGSLGETLRDIVETYAQETDDAIKVMTTLLEPVMIVVIGGVIGFIVVAMLLPVFSLDMFAR